MIAFAFWGIPRAFDETKDSIIKFMKSFNMPYDIYFHTYQINGTYSNPRNKEYDIKIDSKVMLELHPKQYKIDIQEDIAKMLNFKKYYNKPDPWATNYNSVNNFILAMYSKHLVTQMIEESEITYKYIIYLRPDCIFKTMYYDGMLNDLCDNTILIPMKMVYGEYHFNDQFAITTNQNYKIYGNLFHELYEYSKEQMLHAETLNGYNLIINGITWKFIDFDYELIRSKKLLTTSL